MFEKLFDTVIENMLGRMTLEEKAYALTPLDNQYCSIPSQDFYGPTPQDVPGGGQDNWPAGKPVPGEDGRPADGKYHPVAFPSNSAVAMSWDKKLAYDVGVKWAQEAKASPEKINILNRPGMNLKRSPLCGRNYDYLSEDPVQTGILAAEYVKGIQSQGIGACPKHFLANNQEFDRMNTDSVISERVLHEVYLRPWKKMIQEAQPWMIMTSYNKVNGEWVNSSKECMKLLREEIGYEGVVVSDFLAIHHNKVAAHRNQMDIELAAQEIHTKEIVEAVKNGEIKEEELDQIIRRQLRMALYALKQENTQEADLEAFHRESIEIAEQCMTLLKNEDILPVTASCTDRLIVAGELAEKPNITGSGSGYMNGYMVENPLKNICTLAEKAGIQTEYIPGYRMADKILPLGKKEAGQSCDLQIPQICQSDLVLAFVGAPYGHESESYDRPDICLPEEQRDMLDSLTKQTDNIVIVLSGGSVYDMTPWKDKVKGILFAGFAGEGAGAAVANILFGKSEPGGRLTETFPIDFAHTPAYFDFTGKMMEMPHVNYSEGLLTGYRWYDTRHLPVLYPFGYGLSYTTFSYTEPVVDKAVMTPEDTLTVSLDVTNTGKRAGSQVIQLYIHEQGGLFARPEKELRDFAKVFLQPGETKTVKFTLSGEDFAVYSDVLHKWGVQSDRYEILLNTSAQDSIARVSVDIIRGDQMYYFTEMSPLVQFINYPAFHEYLKQNEPQWKQDFFDLEKTEFLVLMLPLPFYRVSEPLQGEPFFTAEKISEIIELCNQYVRRENNTQQR